jgi:hypothetical protein
MTLGRIAVVLNTESDHPAEVAEGRALGSVDMVRTFNNGDWA